MDISPEVLAARAKLKARIGDSRTGGAGTARRTKCKKHASAADDKQTQAQLKRLGCNPIPGIEEVNMFKDDGSVIHFVNPKVQAAVQSNTFVVSGNSETKKLEELLPGIIQQLGPDSMMNLKRLAEQFAASGAGKEAAEGGDDDIPDVGESFEDVSKK
eukprot:TRINITY_DN10447_c0_g1_i1.p1 TRINITY_DN10447_c0_g1~~TRINITY_DN10447_c0_g1_i1.p1  ORF type:complete len:158 (+),score=65.84 TRINITY_DN10447_c0_g1_i1:78-551(+)